MGEIEKGFRRFKEPVVERRSSERKIRPVEAVEPIDHSAVRLVRPDPRVLIRNRLVSEQQDRAVIAAYKMLRTRVTQRLRSRSWNSIAITASRAGEGKTVTAINLAMSLAGQKDKNVILVDLDLRNGSVGRYLGLEDHCYLMDYLDKGVPIEQVMINPGVDGLYVILNDVEIEQSSEALMSPEMNRLVNRLASMGPDTIVIYDLPPLLVADDYLAFSTAVDCVLFVVAESETRREDFQNAGQLLQDMNVLGVVLNKSNDVFETYY